MTRLIPPLSVALASLWIASAGVAQVPTTAPAASPTPAPVPTSVPNPAATPMTRPDAGWTARNDAFNARTKQARERGDIDVIFLGDSITQGWEGAGKAAWQKTFAPLNAVNYGIGGDQTGHVLGRIASGNLDGLAAPAAGRPPRVVVLLIGTNNAGTQTPEQIAGGVKAIVEGVQEKLPKAKVLLLAIFPRGQTPGDREGVTAKRANGLLAKLADGERVRFLDIGPRLIDAGSITRDKFLEGLRNDAQVLRANGTTTREVLDRATSKALGLGDREFSTISLTAGPDRSLQWLDYDGQPLLLLFSRAEPVGSVDVALTPVSGDALRPPLPNVPMIGARLRPGAVAERDDAAGEAAIQALLNRSKVETLDRSIFPDFLHLSAKGYDVWAEAVGPVVQEMLGQE